MHNNESIPVEQRVMPSVLEGGGSIGEHITKSMYNTAVNVYADNVALNQKLMSVHA